MARPRTFEIDDLTETVLDTFWSKGYEATSLAELVTATGLQKSSLYAALGNKRGMYLRALAAYDLRYIDGAINLMTTAKSWDGVRKLLELPALAVEAGDYRGCFLCNASMETLSLDAPAKSLALAGRDKMHKAIIAQLQDHVSALHNLETFADQILAFYFGLRVLARSGTPAKQIREAADSFVDTLEARLG